MSSGEDGHARADGEKHGNLSPLSVKDIAAMAAKTGGPIAGHSELVADGAGVSFATHICDVEVDPDTGATKILRYTVVQDAGKAVHPAYVEGQYQGGAAQGIGWALNEEYVYGEDGCLQNPGFLDYRVPVCSDLPMIGTQILEIPNPNHPYGVRGVGETSIVPPLAAVANAVSNAVGVRMTHIPMSPPRILAALEAAPAAPLMVEVTLWGALGTAAGGKEKLEVEAKDIRELFRKLAEQHPALGPFIERGIAVSIDGVIYRDTWSKELPKDAADLPAPAPRRRIGEVAQFASVGADSPVRRTRRVGRESHSRPGRAARCPAAANHLAPPPILAQRPRIAALVQAWPSSPGRSRRR